MKKKLFLAGILGMVLVFGFLFSGCASTQPVGPNPFVGTWESTGAIVFTLVFNANGTGTYQTATRQQFTYKVDGNTAEIETKPPLGSPPGFGVQRFRVEFTDDGVSMGGLIFKKK